jgi:poly-beta-1,6-N-acetyl-D-glucosamine synthase
MSFAEIMYYTIATLSIVNFIRIFGMLLGSDIYDIRTMRRTFIQRRRRTRTGISVIIPAYNEEAGVIRTIESVLQNTYKYKQVIVVNDGSSDRTLSMLRSYQRRNKGKFTIVNQKNGGKAAAINRAIRYWAKEELVMVVDADSLLHPRAIERMVSRFRNPDTIAAAANVKIIPSRSILGIAQRFEYIISYRMKRSLSVFSVEYIVGGVGSTFRRQAVVDSGLYDTDTMTEDIDLTVKLIKKYGNKKERVTYAADAIAYTEHVMSFKSLIKQRYRWKYGRLQTFSKNKDLFYSREARHSKLLTWYQLPYAIFSELTLIFEPLLVGFILAVVLIFGDITSMLWVYGIVTAFVFFMVLGEDTETPSAKLLLILCLPLVYGLMYILTVVEFTALIKSIRNIKNLHNKKAEQGSWQHVERSGAAVTLPLK